MLYVVHHVAEGLPHLTPFGKEPRPLHGKVAHRYLDRNLGNHIGVHRADVVNVLLHDELLVDVEQLVDGRDGAAGGGGLHLEVFAHHGVQEIEVELVRRGEPSGRNTDAGVNAANPLPLLHVRGVRPAVKEVQAVAGLGRLQAVSGGAGIGHDPGELAVAELGVVELAGEPAHHPLHPGLQGAQQAGVFVGEADVFQSCTNVGVG